MLNLQTPCLDNWPIWLPLYIILYGAALWQIFELWLLAHACSFDADKCPCLASRATHLSHTAVAVALPAELSRGPSTAKQVVFMALLANFHTENINGLPCSSLQSSSPNGYVIAVGQVTESSWLSAYGLESWLRRCGNDPMLSLQWKACQASLSETKFSHQRPKMHPKANQSRSKAWMVLHTLVFFASETL